MPEDGQFPVVDQNTPEAARYTSLWATKDAARIQDMKVFWTFVEVSLQTWINRRPCLSLTVYNTLQSVAEFKADMHNVYIQVRKDLAWAWEKLPFITTDHEIFEVMASWYLEWHAPNLVELEKIAAQQRKKETKLRIAKLAERECQEQEATT